MGSIDHDLEPVPAGEKQNEGIPKICNLEEKDKSESEYLQSWRLFIVIASLCLGTLLVAIDTTIVAVAIPTISTYFQAFDDIQWYGSTYVLMVTAFQPVYGSIYRYFGSKEVYLVSVVIFEVGSILCATASSSSVYIGGRAVAGVGAAGLYQGALAIVGRTVELSKRPLYLGIVLSVFGIAVCFGPPLGGVFTDHASWRWCFWINVPIGAMSLVLIAIFLKVRPDEDAPVVTFRSKLKRLDIIGIILVVGAVCCLLLALQWGQITGHWGQSKVVGCFVGSGLLAMLFAFTQWKKGDSATIPLRILTQRTILTGALYSFFLEMAIYVILFYMPFYFQSAELASATTSGVRVIPFGISQVLAIVIVGAIASRTGYYVPFMVLGQIVGIIGTVLLTRVTTTSRYILVAIYLVVSGFGFGMGLQMPFTGVQVVLSEDDLPIGNAITVFFSQLGASIAIAIGQSVFSSSLRDRIIEQFALINDLHLHPIDFAAVIAAGPKGLASIAGNKRMLLLLQHAYAYAVQRALYVSLVTACVAVPFALGMQWLNVKSPGLSRDSPVGSGDVKGRDGSGQQEI
ncbi:major facilitator superfamily domain-containing protein [Clohesyomyces aquaticus]|uniref:Major facilitator superfamily domain-containing protein n=1 Tax=Clohesyomyces aquaticus TaxID=1231657 RepID=A0A1Y2A3J2_9PLEO|nr:major facilitator superfamily domain-containing protein [Clohesyomyces aquaticus]